MTDSVLFYTFLALYVGVTWTEFLLLWLNLRHLALHGTEVPADFAEAVDSSAMMRASEYTLHKGRISLIDSGLDSVILIIFLFGGMLGVYDRWISDLSHGSWWGGVLFFSGLLVAQGLIGVPLDLYSTFRLEHRFGFNTMTWKLWCQDFGKSILIGVLLTALVTGGVLYLVQIAPHSWWLWVWLFLLLVGLFLLYLSPLVIEPLFYTFRPVQDETLESGIRELMGRAGLTVGSVLQVDASRRSRHSNAYFTGIGRVKRIVLYDILLEQMERQEVLAILAHEVGHWQRGHIRKRLVLTELFALVGCYAASLLLESRLIPTAFGLPDASFAARVLLLAFLYGILRFPFTPLGSWLSRRQELEADDYAVQLTGTARPLATALARLSADNLSNLHPHPLYAGFYYSHPPMIERVRRLLKMEEGKPGAGVNL